MLIPETAEGSEKESTCSTGGQGTPSGKRGMSDQKMPRGGSSGSGKYFILRQMQTEMKPTSLIQISQRHIAVATGFLNERSSMEILNVFTGQQVSVLEHHEDMIDSMRLVDLSRYTHRQDGDSSLRNAAVKDKIGSEK